MRKSSCKEGSREEESSDPLVPPNTDPTLQNSGLTGENLSYQTQNTDKTSGFFKRIVYMHGFLDPAPGVLMDNRTATPQNKPKNLQILR